MEEKIKEKPILSVCLIFALVLAVHIFEALVLRMDETVFAENFINKLFGILIIFIALCLLKWKWADIGFSRHNFWASVVVGFIVAISSFLVGYLLEILILIFKGQKFSLGIFTTSFSLVGDVTINKGFGFILMCIMFNIINVIMEEGLFRGLFFKLSNLKHSEKTAIGVQSLLFGLWHIVTPLHNLIDGDINVANFIIFSVGYVILAGLMGIKWSLLYKMTGNLYAGMADHFFNNCIASNLLHVVTDTGIDELMIVRIVIAQLLSFFIVLIAYHKHKKLLKTGTT